MKYRRNIPFIDENEINAVREVLESGMLVRGKVVQEFERMFAKMHNKKYCVMVSSGTAALHLALECIKREQKKNGKVIIPDYGFMATGNAVLLAGLDYKVADIDPNTYNMDITTVDVGPNDIIMPVHVFGNPCNGDEYSNYDNYVIEDAATAIGSDGTGWGDLQCYSLHGAKIITSGIGGCLTTNNKKWAELAEELARSGRPHWRQPSFNYQISNINAAVAIEQLKKLNFIIARRRELAERYNDFFQAFPNINVQETTGTNYQSYVIRIRKDVRDKLVELLRADGIEVCMGYYSMTRTYFEGEAKYGQLLDDQQICLPLYPQMTEDDQDFIIEKFKEHYWSVV